MSIICSDLIQLIQPYTLFINIVCCYYSSIEYLKLIIIS